MPNKKDILLFYVLSFTWGILTTLVGLFVFLFIFITMHKKLIIRIIGGRIAVTIKGTKFGGMGMGIVYFVSGNDSRHTHLHELGHTLQSTWLGPLFILIVGIPSGFRYHYRNFISKKDPTKMLPPYDSIWFEGHASAIGYRYFSEAVDKALRGA